MSPEDSITFESWTSTNPTSSIIRWRGDGEERNQFQPLPAAVFPAPAENDSRSFVGEDAVVGVGDRGLDDADAAISEAVEHDPQCEDRIGDVVQNAGEEHDVEPVLGLGPGVLVQRREQRRR